MLENLRQILEEESKIENINGLMVEATDSDMMDMFIDEDGEAEIPESELNKILAKIPEYNQEEELNKKLKRLTESYIPDYDILQEGPIKSIVKLSDNVSKSPVKSAVFSTIFASCISKTIPDLIITSSIAYGAMQLKNKSIKKKVAKYVEGDDLTQEKILELLNACEDLKELKKYKKWINIVYRNLNTVTDANPEVQKNVEGFREWLDTEVRKSLIPEKEAIIKKAEKDNKIAKESMTIYETAQDIVDDLF